MRKMWFAAWECLKDGHPVKMSGVFDCDSDIPLEAYDEIKEAIMNSGGVVSEVWVISFNRI